VDLDDFRLFLSVDEAMADDTVDTYLRRVRAALKKGFDLDGFVADQDIAHTEGRKHLARNTHLGPGGYNGHVRWLNAVSRFAGHDLRFKTRRPSRIQPKGLSSSQIARALAHTGQTRQSTLRARALVQFALTVGARASEVAALETTDLDSRRSTVEIRKPAKGGLRRTLPVPRELWDPTKPFALWLRYRPVPETQPTAVWTTDQRGDGSGIARRMSKLQLTRIMDAIRRATGVRINFVTARHTVATRLHQAGADPVYIQHYLGHSKIASTMVYINTSAEDAWNRFQNLALSNIIPKGDKT
jgi:integrase